MTQCRQVLGRRGAGGDQQQPDDAHGLLRVVAAVSDAVGRGRDELQARGTSDRPCAARRAGRATRRAIMISAPSVMPSSGETKMKIAVLMMPGASSGAVPALAIVAPIMPPISACDELDGMP